MKKLLLVFAILSLFLWAKPTIAIDCDGNPPTGIENESLIKEYIQKCNEKITSLQGEQTTLKQTIATINSKINLAQAQINQTQVQINTLEKEVTVLDGVLETVTDSMDQLAKIYTARVRESYKRFRVTSIDLIFSTNSIGDYFTKLKYLNTVKAKDQLILAELERSRKDYDQRKQDKVTKQQEVERLKTKLVAQKKTLDVQQTEKQKLLIATQNDEKKFEEIRQSAQAELAAIQDIIAGKGIEEYQKDVKSGDKIASIIEGNSCSSTGTHLHFTVARGDSSSNPASFLKSTNLTWDLCGWWPNCDNPVSFSGSWEWPLKDSIRITQTYGLTGYAKTGAYGYEDGNPIPHNGVDMVSNNREVFSTMDGKLYRGSYYISRRSCYLRYMSVKSNDGDLRTLYMHINYM